MKIIFINVEQCNTIRCCITNNRFSSYIIGLVLLSRLFGFWLFLDLFF